MATGHARLDAERVGISAAGWYVPRLRMAAGVWSDVWRGSASEGVRSVSVPDLDEDVVTMAVAAANHALDGLDRDGIDEVYIATASSEYVVKSTAAVVCASLFHGPVRAVDFGASARAVGSALLAAHDAVAAGRARRVLVVATDHLPAASADQAESRFGAAAAAVVVDADAALARFDAVVSAHSTVTSYWQSVQRPTVRRFDDARLERVVEHVGGIAPVLAAVQEKDVVAAAVSPRAAKDVFKGVALRAVVGTSTYAAIGDTANAGALLALLEALGVTDEGDGIALVVQGSGAGAEAIRFVRGGAPVTSPVDVEPGEHLDYIGYLKSTRRLVPELPGEVGSSYPASAAWVRTEDMLVKPVAQLCRSCGALNYPRRSICIDCRSRELTDAPLPMTGTVVSYNVQHVMAVVPEQSPSPICVAQMDGVPAGGYGGKVSAMVLQQDCDRLAIGAPVLLTFRRAGEELGLVKYGFKFAVVSS